MHLSFKRTALWHQSNFIKLWMGQTISLFGSAITTLALPLTAISILHASAQQMGFLFALSQTPPLLFGLIVGAWVDRIHRRPLLIELSPLIFPLPRQGRFLIIVNEQPQMFS